MTRMIKLDHTNSNSIHPMVVADGPEAGRLEVLRADC